MTSDLRELAKSFVSLSGAASILGVNQFVRLLDVRSPRAAFDEAARRLDSVTEATTAQLDGRLSSVFARTDVLQRGVVDFLAALVTLNPSGLLAFSAPVLDPAASALGPVIAALDRALPGIDAGVLWTELRNKIEIYFLVENAASRLRFSPVESTPLSVLVERADALGQFLSLWVIEGLGHIYGEQAMKNDPSPRGLLTGTEAAAARSGALPMLHAGIGLAFAQNLLDSMSKSTPAGTIRAAIQAFVRLCRDNSQPGYIGAAYESLGLVTRTFHQDLVAAFDRELAQSAGDLLGYFWHGVGRAIYFAPRNFLPCAEIDWAGNPGGAPHEVGQLNVTAGLAWAVTLVNMRQPAVMGRVLRRHVNALSQTPGFANGVASAVLMRTETSPGASFIQAFIENRPEPGDHGLDRAWEHLIRGPVESALKYLYEPLKERGRFGEIFHFSTAT
jgi:hypothetical protein